MTRVEHFTHEIDFVQQEDGSWRADGYPHDGARPKTSQPYPSRTALMIALYQDREFWKDAYAFDGPHIRFGCGHVIGVKQRNPLDPFRCPLCPDPQIEKKGVEHNG